MPHMTHIHSCSSLSLSFSSLYRELDYLESKLDRLVKIALVCPLHKHTHTPTHPHTYAHPHTHTLTHVRSPTHPHTHTHSHSHTHTHSHTYASVCFVTLGQSDDRMDARFGFEKYTSGPARLGWLLNMQPVSFSTSLWLASNNSPHSNVPPHIHTTPHHPPTHTHTHTHNHTHTHTHSLTHTNTHTHTLSLSHTHTHKLCFHRLANKTYQTKQTVYRDAENHVRSAVDFYFMEEDGGRFKVAFPYLPYFFIKVKVRKHAH